MELFSTEDGTFLGKNTFSTRKRSFIREHGTFSTENETSKQKYFFSNSKEILFN